MTIKDLAERTGYAVGTVSRALNGHPNVSEKARQTILQAAQECGFELNINAKQLKQRHATSILVVVKGTSNELFGELVESVQTLLRGTRYPVFVDYLDEDSDEVTRAIQLCREKKPLGILFMGGNTCNFQDDSHKIQIPCLLLTNDATSLAFPNLSSVCVDDHQACRCAMDSLIALGHRKIVVVGGDRETSEISRLRYEGCLESLRNHGIAHDETQDYRGVRFSYEGGYQATAQLLANGRQFTALFAECDVMAIGAIRALRDHGLRVPEDVSVMGYDGLPLGSYMVPKLSTIAQPVQTLARRSVEILTACIEGASSRHETVPFTLFQRESTRRVDTSF